uniref:Protein FAR1-RELATED SEQUENCE n=1 Tax=Lactuca sativa TaxID=4236 RepID=A0A9R1WRH5_LACSA|nr:hypothetical protein LSAT_V11C900499870 [Lactuca sativa]
MFASLYFIVFTNQRHINTYEFTSFIADTRFQNNLYSQVTNRQVRRPVYYVSEVITYLKKTWLTQYKEKFVSVWTDVFLHFGNYTTNRVESQHAKVKLYLDSSQSDLATILPRIHDAVQS